MKNQSAEEKFTALLKELQEEQNRKADIVTSMNSLRVNEDFTFSSEELGKVRMTEHAFGQLCQQAYKYTLPADYFKKLYAEDPQHFAETLNYHLSNGRDLNRKFRMVQDNDGSNISEVRGIVSEKYIPYDNLDAISIFMDTAKELPHYELTNVNLNDRMMFLRVMFPTTERDFGRANTGQDDKNFVALDLLNSEVGYTSIVANSAVYRQICTNGMVAKEAEYGFFKQRHMFIDPAEVNEKLRHSIIYGVENGKQMLDKLQRARQIKIDNPYEVITDYGKRRAFSDKMLRDLRGHYDAENDGSLFGVVNSFTRLARDTSAIDKRINIEKYASSILDRELKKSA